MDALTDHQNKDMREFLYADDLAILGNSWRTLVKNMPDRKTLLESRDLKVNIRKLKL